MKKNGLNVKSSEASSLNKLGVVNLTICIGVAMFVLALLYTALCTNFFHASTAEEKRITQLHQDASMAKAILAQVEKESRNSQGVDVRWYEKQYKEAFKALQDEVEKAPEGAVSPRVKDFIQHNEPTVSAMAREDWR